MVPLLYPRFLVKEWIPLSGHGSFKSSGFVFMEISMSTRPIIRLTQAEYLQLDRQSELRYEFLAGEVFVMTVASRNHNLITVNVAGALSGALGARASGPHAPGTVPL
jgi:hypothetical protein